jgi:hypothetical protein
VLCFRLKARKTGKAFNVLAPKKVLTIKEVGKAMINAVLTGYPKSVLEIDDIRKLANSKNSTDN